jgi:hypothetical protein
VLTKCANPTCSEEFRSLRRGRLYVAEPTTAGTTNVSTATGKRDKLGYLWLCDACCKTMSVTVDSDQHVVITPVQKPVDFESRRFIALKAFGRR